MKIKMLNNNEYNVINKIANKTKADCWFLIMQTKDGCDFVRDLEEGKDVTLKDGIEMLMECIDCKENYEHCSLSVDEENTLNELMHKLNIDFNKEW